MTDVSALAARLVFKIYEDILCTELLKTLAIYFENFMLCVKCFIVVYVVYVLFINAL